MTGIPRSRRGVATAFAWVALAGTVLPSPVNAQEDPAPVTAGSPGRTALVVFVSYRGNVAVPVHPTRVRQGASSRLAQTLAEEGRQVVTAPELEPLMRRHRLRSERDLSREFLRDLAGEFSVDEVIVAKLVTYDDRVLLLGRGLSTEGGWLRWAGVAEEESGSSPWKDEAVALGNLERLMEITGDRLVKMEKAPTGDPAADALVTLPLASYGLGRGDSDLVTLCLLGSLLRAGRWSVPDPALVVAELQGGGMDPYQLGADARQRLVAGFACKELLAPVLAAFPPGGARAGGSPIPGDDSFDQPFNWGRRQSPVLLTVTLIDARSGSVVKGEAEYLKPDDKTGIFGKTRPGRLSRRYEEGTDHLVHSLLQGKGST